MRRFLSVITLLLVLGFPSAALADGDRCFCYFETSCGSLPSNFSGIPYNEIDDGNACATVCSALSGAIDDTYDRAMYIVDHENHMTDTLYSQEQDNCETFAGTDDNRTLLQAMKESSSAATTELKEPIIPHLSVPIPDLTFSDVVVGTGYMEINFLGEYVAALYNWLLYAGFIIAVVMVMIGGVQYIIGSGLGQVEKAKSRIRSAITGLVLLLATYTILYTVNPELTSFESMQIDYVQPIQFDFYDENLEGCPDVKGKVKECSTTVLGELGGSYTPEVVIKINQIAQNYGADAILMATHLQKETGGDFEWGRGIGPCGEIGPAQFMPTTYDHIVGIGGTCCTEISRKGGIQDRDRNNCTTTSDEWPPTFEFAPNDENTTCKDDICGNCQVAADSCIEFFDTSLPSGLDNVFIAQAKFVENTLDYVGGDYALEMCAYNGSGAGAAQYAVTAAEIYADFCKRSGGTQ